MDEEHGLDPRPVPWGCQSSPIPVEVLTVCGAHWAVPLHRAGAQLRFLLPPFLTATQKEEYMLTRSMNGTRSARWRHLTCKAHE